MARQRYLLHAPITEAVFDVRVSLATELNGDVLEELRSAFLPDFPVIENQRSYEGLIQFDAGAVSQTGSDLGVVGLLCRSEERHEAVQLSGTGYAFSKLRPYTSWPQVIETARTLFARYAGIVDIQTITRLGVRYINQFGVPRHESIDQYLTKPPRPPENIDRAMLMHSFERLMLRDERSEVSARLVQLTEFGDARTNVIIDTDCFRPEESKVSSDFWPAFDELRTMKNRTFFGSITDRAAEEFE